MFTSKELFMMNGGNKLYIGKDGFADVYQATPAEEALWTLEVVAVALKVVDQEENPVSLSNAIDNLRFHRYKDLKPLLIEKMQGATESRRQVFSLALKNIENEDNNKKPLL